MLVLSAVRFCNYRVHCDGVVRPFGNAVVPAFSHGDLNPLVTASDAPQRGAGGPCPKWRLAYPGFGCARISSLSKC